MKTFKTIDNLLLLVITIGITACSGSGRSAREDANAQKGHPPSRNLEREDTYADGPSDSTRAFVKEAGSDGLMEVQLANLALEKSQNMQVKNLAEMIRRDHQDANGKLKALAGTNGWEVPKEMMEKHKETVNRLSSLSGVAFDQLYVQTMIQGHQKAIEKFEQAANSSQETENDQIDQELAGWISQTLPVLRKHLEQAQQIRDQL